MNRTPAYSLRQLVGYFLRLGTTGFGGPPALVSTMHRNLVQERSWITDEDYREGLALAQLAPGPLAAQLAIYLGYVHYGVLGATVIGLAFVLPSFVMVLVLGWIYVRLGGMPWMQDVFYGIGTAVIGIIAVGTYRLIRKTINPADWIGWSLFGISALTTAWLETELVWLILGCGVVYWLLKAPPTMPRMGRVSSLVPIWEQWNALLADSVLWQIAVFFTKAGTFVFGSGLAIVPFLYGGVVREHGWLNEQQFLDAVAVAMITPGPVVITVGFIGYLVDGFLGAVVAAVATFLPCYLLTILPAPYFRRYGRRPGIKAFVGGVTMAAIGAIAGSVVVLASRQINNLPVALMALGTMVLLYRFPKLSELYVIGAAALLGLLLH